ncbi:MAG: phosphoglucosamine mutase [Thermoanaerobaculia bacterium]
MQRLFGTDGIRAPFGEAPLDEATVRRVAAALAAELARERARPRLVLGGDTRDSTPILCRWLAETLTAHGVECIYLGVLPTPGVAVLTRRLEADCGIAVSASHNPHPDNGIKLIDAAGFKWASAAERRLEERLGDDGGEAATAALGEKLEPVAGAVEKYLEELTAPFPRPSPALAGLRVAVDASHGAASPWAGELFRRLGAEATVINAEPDGTNINAGCGSTYPEVIAALTRDTGSDLGFAFDGDADRVIVADERGEVRDGDAILYLWARELEHRGELPGHRIVATSMSNLGLETALRADGISVVRCDVGDRAVVRTLREQGIVLGGEQSGHIVHLGLGTQGDGLMTAIQVAALQRRGGRPLSEMLAGFQRFPQLLHNVRVRHQPDFETLPRVMAVRDAVIEKLGDEGRLVLRYSGTEPLARVMLEGRDRQRIEALAAELTAVIAEELS